MTAGSGRSLSNATVQENGSLALALPAGDHAVALRRRSTPTSSPTPTPSPTPSPTIETEQGAAGSGDPGEGGDGGGGDGETGEGDGGSSASPVENQVGGAGSDPRPLDDVPPEAVGGGLAVALAAGVGTIGLRSLGDGSLLQGARTLRTMSAVALQGGGESLANEAQDPVDGGDSEAPGIVVTVDPLSASSWAAEPVLQAVTEWAEDTFEIEYEPAPVREFDDPAAMQERWAAVDDRFPVPVDPSFWDEEPPGSTELVNRGFAAAAEQGYGSEYVRQQWLRAVAGGQPIDDEETLLEVAETTAEEVDLDVEQ